jgi:hypothetical protein
MAMVYKELGLTEGGNCILNRVELLCNLCCGRHLGVVGGG